MLPPQGCDTCYLFPLPGLLLSQISIRLASFFLIFAQMSLHQKSYSNSTPYHPLLSNTLSTLLLPNYIKQVCIKYTLMPLNFKICERASFCSLLYPSDLYKIEAQQMLKDWWECRINGILTDCWSKYKLIQLWKIFWQFLLMLNIYTTNDPPIPLLGMYSTERHTYIYADIE